jgi:uroporphyrinogen-III synthase
VIVETILDEIGRVTQSVSDSGDHDGRFPMAKWGLRALVTRPRKESEALARALAARSIEPVIEPLMKVHYLAPVALDFGGVQAVLCTSANGVRALARASVERRVPLFAVGDATAERAHAEGFTSVASAAGDAGDLARLAAARLRPQDGPLLHVAGNVVAGDLVEKVRERGFVIERRVLYKAQPARALSQSTVDALRRGSIDFVLFFSPRTAAIFAELAGAAGVTECCTTMTVVSISRAADAALGNLRWRDRRIAERPNQSALLAALDRVLCERPGG